MPSSPLAASHFYRPDIDGLRAIAVSLVLVFHAFPEALPGGFVGVDVFFVISGYLISGLIFADLKKGRFTFTDFYSRRIRRIFPALFVVLAACLIAGWFTLLPDEYAQLGKHVAGGAGFVSNIVLLFESGYFDAAAELKPLLHLWSLGIEEQFYFLWPLLLVFAWGRRWGPLALILVILLGSFVWNLERVHAQSPGAYYLPFTRFWELMIGCALAYTHHVAVHREWRWIGHPHWQVWARHGASWAGVTAILLAGFVIDRESSFPGYWALLPTLGTFALIAAGPSAWVNRVLLAHPGMVFVGLISFPLYLWHWPLLAFPRIVLVDLPSAWLRGGALILSLACAWATYRFIERPIRFGKKQPQIINGLAALMAGLLALGLLTQRADGFVGRMEEKAQFSAFFNGWAYFYNHNLRVNDRHECNFYEIVDRRVKEGIEPSCYTPHTVRAIFLWGDSHAQHLNYGLQQTLPADVSLLQVGSSGCAPAIVDHERDALGTCNRANRFALEKIDAVHPETVIIGQQGNHEATDFDAIADRLRQAGVRHLIVVGPVPQWKPALNKLLLKSHWGAIPLRLNDHLEASARDTDRLMKARYATSSKVTYLSLIDHLCNAAGCLVHLGDITERLITYDYGHFTLPASLHVVANTIEPLLRQKMAHRQDNAAGKSPTKRIESPDRGARL